MLTVEGHTYIIDNDLVVVGSGMEKCFSIQSSYDEKEFRKDTIEGLLNIFLYQNTFPITLSLIDMGSDVDFSKDFNTLSLKYSIDNYDGYEDKDKMVNKFVVQVEISNAEELKRALDYSFVYASCGQKLVISTNCKLYNDVYSEEDMVYIKRLVECCEVPNSTIVYSDCDDLIWGIITSCEEISNKNKLEKVINGENI